MKDRLSTEHLLDRIVTSSVIDALLQTLQIQAPEPPPGQTESGQVVFGVQEHALGVFNLSLIPASGRQRPARLFPFLRRRRGRAHRLSPGDIPRGRAAAAAVQPAAQHAVARPGRCGDQDV